MAQASGFDVVAEQHRPSRRAGDLMREAETTATCCRHAEAARRKASGERSLREIDAWIEEIDEKLRAAPTPNFDKAILRQQIRQWLPASEGDDLEHRVALLIAREYAMWLACRSEGQEAVEHARQAQRIAGLFLYADVPAVRLGLVVEYCRHLVRCTFLADHLESEGCGQ